MPLPLIAAAATLIPWGDLITSIGGLVLPSVLDIARKKIVGDDTPQGTMTSLALTKPEVLPQYVEATAKLNDSETDFFNRDMPSPNLVSQWVLNLRASIRPVTVIMAMIMLGVIVIGSFDESSAIGVRLACEANISSWFGSKISLGK